MNSALPQIESDNAAIEAVIRRIAATLITEGGMIDPQATLACRKGSLSIEKSSPAGPGPLLRLPHHCLIPYGEFDIRAEGSDLVIGSCTDSVTPLQKKLMEDMLALYNLTGKLDYHRATSPYFMLQKHRAILETLLEGRDSASMMKMKSRLEETGSPEDSLAGSYFKSRLLGYRPRKNSEEIIKVLMPVIDFMNHNFRGAPFRNEHKDDTGTLTLAQANPVDQSPECYATYGRLDALDTFLTYGFADTSAPFVRSVPVEIDLGSIGTIRIRAQEGRVFKSEIPRALQGMQFYVPVLNVDPYLKRGELSHIFIPQENALHSLRRIIDFVLIMLDSSMSEIHRIGYVRQAEDIILQKNRTFYEKLIKQAEALENAETLARESLQGLSNVQLGKIALYQSLRV